MDSEGVDDAQLATGAFRGAVASMEAAFESLRAHRPGSVERVETVVETLIGHLKTSDSLLVSLLGGRAGAAGAAHTAVNVGIFALRIGMALQYAHPELSELGLVALLHDTAALGAPAARAGVGDAAAVLRALGAGHAHVADLVVQAHEQLNGRGADGARRPRAHQHAQIVALAATYEQLSRQEPGGPRAWPPTAVKEILRRERARFPDAILKALIQISVEFPVGAFVRLNSGEVARVVAKNPGLPLRPVVEIPAREGRQRVEAKTVDLRDSPFLHVREFLGAERPAAGAATLS